MTRKYEQKKGNSNWEKKKTSIIISISMKREKWIIIIPTVVSILCRFEIWLKICLNILMSSPFSYREMWFKLYCETSVLLKSSHSFRQIYDWYSILLIKKKKSSPKKTQNNINYLFSNIWQNENWISCV